MLISDKHRFIFIHVAKVGGQSVTNALMPYAASNWQKSLSALVPYRYQLKVYTKLKQYANIGFYPQPYSDHIRGPELRKKLGDDVFESYYSFAFVRNPWDWILSQYTYARKNPRHHRHKLYSSFSSFSDFVKWHVQENQRIKFQKDYVYDVNGNKVLDFVGKQEQLVDDFAKVCKEIGVDAKLPRLNVSSSKSYREIYDEETRELVRQRFAEDIQLFDYEF